MTKKVYKINLNHKNALYLQQEYPLCTGKWNRTARSGCYNYMYFREGYHEYGLKNIIG